MKGGGLMQRVAVTFLLSLFLAYHFLCQVQGKRSPPVTLLLFTIAHDIGVSHYSNMTMQFPKYVSAEQVMLEWLKQPGNYERFVQACAEGKRQGRVSESKRDVAASICTLLKNAGIYDRSPHAVSIKLCVWVRQYKRAQAVAASGGK